MEEVLKGLQGKNLSKKKLFDILLELNLENIGLKKENVIKEELINNVDEVKEEKIKEEFKCGACMKNFANKSSLKRHLDRFTVCKEWIKIPQKPDTPLLTKGIHHIIDELLERAIGENGETECKFCKTKFITKGNHHKHFNTATVCNRLAFQELKKLINSL
jgi:hypothetical protein